jgi:hypothetical protein
LDVRRSRADLWLLAVVTLVWLFIGAYVVARTGTESAAKLAMIGVGWGLGCLAILQNTRLRVWTRGSTLFVRNSLIKRQFGPADIHGFTTRSYAGGHWLVEMQTGSGVVSMHATDRRARGEVEEFAAVLDRWLRHSVGERNQPELSSR